MDYKNLFIGGISGIISRSATAPIELAKIQSQNKYMPHSSITSVIRKEGVLGLWKGNFANCVRIFPQNAINYSVYSYFRNNSNFIKNNTLLNFYAGALGGMTAMTITYPLENARSRLSLQTNKNHYKNLTDVFKKTPITRLYQGLRMSLLGFTPYTALNFMFFNYYKECRFTEYEQINNLLSGGLSGISSVTFTYPTDLIRRRLQLQGFDKHVPQYNGILDCCKKIYIQEGIIGFYRGLGFCYLKLFPSVAIQFWTIEFLRNNL